MKTLQKPTKNLVKNPPQQKLTKAQKYIKDSTWVNKELQSMIDAAHDNQQIISKTQLFAPKQYSRHQFNKWQHKYTDIPSIQERLKKIEELIESNLIHAGMTRNPAFFIFLLKNHYGYQDKREVETETTHIFKVSRGDLKPLKAKQVQNTVTPPKA